MAKESRTVPLLVCKLGLTLDDGRPPTWSYGLNGCWVSIALLCLSLCEGIVQKFGTSRTVTASSQTTVCHAKVPGERERGKYEWKSRIGWYNGEWIFKFHYQNELMTGICPISNMRGLLHDISSFPAHTNGFPSTQHIAREWGGGWHLLIASKNLQRDGYKLLLITSAQNKTQQLCYTCIAESEDWH